jgi:hypothetical protein
MSAPSTAPGRASTPGRPAAGCSPSFWNERFPRPTPGPHGRVPGNDRYRHARGRRRRPDAFPRKPDRPLAPPERRGADSAFLDAGDGGEELTTVAWCWAALLEIDVAPEDIYHGTAYPRGDSTTIIDAARRGTYIGFPLLQVWGMAFDEPNARLRGVEPFPHMVRWVRE